MAASIDLAFKDIADLPRCLRTSACVKDTFTMTISAHSALHLARVIERGLVLPAPVVWAEPEPALDTVDPRPDTGSISAPPATARLDRALPPFIIGGLFVVAVQQIAGLL